MSPVALHRQPSKAKTLSNVIKVVPSRPLVMTGLKVYEPKPCAYLAPLLHLSGKPTKQHLFLAMHRSYFQKAPVLEVRDWYLRYEGNTIPSCPAHWLVCPPARPSIHPPTHLSIH